MLDEIDSEIAKNIQAIWHQKRAIIHELLSANHLVREATPDLLADRSRIDLMLYQNKLGTHIRDGKFIEELPAWSLTPDLLRAIDELKRALPPLELAHLRVRANVVGKRGVFISPPADQPQLLSTNEKALALYAERLRSAGWVVEISGVEPKQLESWLPTFSLRNEEVAAKSFISNQSQPGKEALRALTALTFELLEGVRVRTWSGLNSGYGALTVALSTFLGNPSLVAEGNPLAQRALESNREFFDPRQESRLEAVALRLSAKLTFPGELLVVEAPATGVGDFFKLVDKIPHHVLLLNSELKGLIHDVVDLRVSHTLKRWSSADLSPATPQVVVASLWEKH